MSSLFLHRLGKTLAASTLGLAVFLSDAAAWTSQQLNDMMKDGVNMGQYFENKDWRTRTDLPPISRQSFDRIVNKGLKHVRIPVTWGYRLDAAGTINPTFLNTVQTSVNNALDAGLVVVLNSHHETWFETYWGPTGNRNKKIRLFTTQYGSDGKLGVYREDANGRTPQTIHTSIYGQIVRRFQGGRYDRLIFEGLNEPRTAQFSDASVNELNRILFGVVQSNYDASKGGARQTFMMSVNNANNVMSLNSVTLPTYSNWSVDDRVKRLMVTIHYYHTQNWTHNQAPAATRWNINATAPSGDYGQLIYRFNLMRDNNNTGVPLNIGEFGVMHANNVSKNATDLENWYMVVTSASKNRGFSATAWDDGGWFGILTHGVASNGRKNGEFYMPPGGSIREKILNRVNNYDNY